MVVNDELKDPIRSHLDLEKNNAKFTRKAMKVRCSVCICTYVCMYIVVLTSLLT